ncbi:diguanylate cyclase (GGDEF) domain-containing protein [Lentzea flaviverrucosa]|uniref:Diguanylate cyclase (GGDEF) domain-containing protein n=1 Tax=Lentzea flaviverrucosa TaxID=200379 RepID=A0A1H9X5W3_9PSEU|nr:diguanylate cyclase (GGDEF) domain-containing protein [Lentzea flaviverrucosa]
MKNSLTDRRRSRALGLTPIRNWDLWTVAPSAIAYFFVLEAAVAVAAIWLLTRLTAVSTDDWLRFGALIAAITIHLTVVRRAEEARRNEASGPHIDLTSVWTFAAAVALPGGLAVIATIWMRILIQPIARRQPYRFVFGTASMLASTLLSWALVHLSGVSLAATGNVPTDLSLVLILAIAAVVYWFVQVMTVAAAFKIVTPNSKVLGSKVDNMLEMSTLGAGAMLGMLMTSHWVGPLLLTVPVILVNALLSRAGERRTHLERLLREQEQLHQRLAADAHTDYRTGLLNTNGLTEYAGRLAERCRLDGEPMTVLVIDLDHFKRINDTWGHPAGNAVLAEVGRILREKLRPGDVAGRDGGEEFVVALKDTPVAQGVTIAERIREAIGSLAVPTTDKHRNVVTLYGREIQPPEPEGESLQAISASIGVAVIPDNGPDMATAQHSADAALYKAKENGRNQVRVAGLDIPPRLMPAPRQDDATKPITTRTA